MRHRYREPWLHAAVSALRPTFRAAGYTLPRKLAISCGWPSVGGEKQHEAQCWVTKASPAGINEIFISPVLADELKVADAIVHELIHAALDSGYHGREFRLAMKALGLVGRPISAHMGRRLKAEVAELIRPLGPYPHAGLKP